MSRLIETLPDFRPVLDAAQQAQAAGDMGALARFQGSTLVPCVQAGCWRAAVVSGEQDAQSLAELMVHGWSLVDGGVAVLCPAEDAR